MTIELVPLCSVTGKLRDPLVVGGGPLGMRLVVEVEAMSLAGRFEAEMVGAAAADWALLAGEVVTLDVRATVKTHDGALVFITYTGRMNMGGDAPGTLFVTPTFETGDERYAWLNAIQAVGKGQSVDNVLTYDWYELR